jgi:hypothetical protein
MSAFAIAGGIMLAAGGLALVTLVGVVLVVLCAEMVK